jgi:leader peptidase (prepilin peptidase)/N-methyltransferase
VPSDSNTLFWAAVAFAFGAVTGSYLNVCIARLPEGTSLLVPSRCPACGHRLAFFPDMVPLLSQWWCRSRCRYCGVKFSWRYLGVELFTACTFSVAYYRYVVFSPPEFSETTANWCAIAAMLFAAALIVIFFLDFEKYIIPDGPLLIVVGASVAKDIYLIWQGHRPLWQSIPGTPWTIPIPLSVLGCILAFWLLWQFAMLSTAVLGRETLGFADPYLYAAIGAFLIPWNPLLVALLIAVILRVLVWVLQSTPSAGDTGEPEWTIPPHCRRARLRVIATIWVLLICLWLAAFIAVSSPRLGIGLALVAALVAGWQLAVGSREWDCLMELDWYASMEESLTAEPDPRILPFGLFLVAGALAVMLLFGDTVLR